MNARFTCEDVARAALGGPVKREGAELLYRCPQPERHSNGDAHPSLKINTKKNVWSCFPCAAKGTAWALAAFLAHLDPEDKSELGAWLKERGLLNGTKRSSKQGTDRKLVATYTYTNPDGGFVARKLRFEPGRDGQKKDFAWQRWENAAWVDGLAGVKTPLYRCREIQSEQAIAYVEGEKAADAGVKLGLSTTTAGAVNNFRPDHAEVLRGKDVVIFPDNDRPGREHAQRVAAALHGLAKSIRIVVLQGLPEKGDLYDFVDGGGTYEVLAEQVRNTPEWTTNKISGAELLDRIAAFIQRFVALSEAQRIIITLWVIHTHLLPNIKYPLIMSLVAVWRFQRSKSGIERTGSKRRYEYQSNGDRARSRGSCIATPWREHIKSSMEKEPLLSEISLEIANYNAITVRLEPTTVAGRNLAGRPALYLPFKLQLIPLRGQTGELPYTLVRFAGKLQNQRLNEFASFDVGPLAIIPNASTNYFRQQEAMVLLDRQRVRKFEDARAEANAQIQISISCLIWYPAKQEFEARTSTGFLDLLVPKSHWIDSVLSVWNVDNVKLVQVEFPADRAGENFRASYARVEEAERLFADAQYKQVLTSLRLALEGLAKNFGFASAGEEFFASFFASCHPDKTEKARKALAALYRFLHLGPHEQSGQGNTNNQAAITRQDARFALTMAYAMFEYITPNN